jgi:hypothetical protein
MHQITLNRIVCRAAAVLVACGCAVAAHAADSGTLYGVAVSDNALIVRSLNLADSRPAREHGKFARQADERLAAIFQNQDRSLGLVRTSTKKGSTRRALVSAAGTPEAIVAGSDWEASGLPATSAISSLLVPATGPAIALVGHYSDTPPYSLVTLNLQPGQTSVASTLKLNPVARYAHLTQCPDGSIYATSLAPQWDPQLVRVDLAKQQVTLLKELALDGKSLRNDVRDLACAPSGKLYALADPAYSGTNWLFALDPNAGALTRVRKFDVERITFAR